MRTKIYIKSFVHIFTEGANKCGVCCVNLVLWEQFTAVQIPKNLNEFQTVKQNHF